MSQVAPFFSEMEHYISESRAAIANGQEVELLGLDEKINRLCEMVEGLSKEEQMMYEDRLQALLEELNALGLDLKAQHESIRNIPLHRNANVAYKTADSRDNFGIRKDEEK